MARRDGTSERSAAPTRNGRAAQKARAADTAAARQTPATGDALESHQAGGAREVASAAPRLARRQVVARLDRLANRLPDGAVRHAVRRLARHVSRRDDGRQARGRRLSVLGALLDAVAATPAGAERWRGCEAAAWGVARLRREARSGPAGIETTALVDRLQRCLAAAVEGVGRGDTAAAACVLATATLLPDVAGCRDLEGAARAALEAEILDRVTADGAVRPTRATDGAAIIAAAGRWAEAREASTSVTGRVPWSERTDARFRAAGDTALTLIGPIDASRPGSIGRRAAPAGIVLLEVIEEAGGRKARATARHLQRGDVRAMSARGGTAGLLPLQRGLAEGGQAVIRSGWGPGDLRLWLDWEPAMPRLEIAVGSRTLVAGPWRVEVAADGRSVEADGPWRMSSCERCRHGTFLEIVQPLVGGGEIQRQVVVLARDRVVLLADAVVLPPGTSTIGYRGTISAANAMTVERAAESREVSLVDGRARAVLMPLALPEWNAASAPGGLEVSAGARDGRDAALEVRLSGAERRLYAPLWMDVDARRAGGPITWRQLTVADTRRILGRHEATGYRVQAGRDQWLVYRALDEPRNRTLLGCNVACEFLLGRIKPRGRVGRSIEIE